MSSFQEKLDEFYLNYDTALLLKEDSEHNEIISLFKEELDYPEDLTSALLKFNKSYLKSVVMRIKVRQSKLSSQELKSDLLKYNDSLLPILDKLLSEKFQKQYENVVETQKTTVKEETLQQNLVEETEDQSDEEDDDEEEVEETRVSEEDELTDEQLLKLFLGEKVKSASSSEKIKLVDLFESFNNYCTENEYEYIKASTFKKLLKGQWGKAEGKGESSVYTGYELC